MRRMSMLTRTYLAAAVFAAALIALAVPASADTFSIQYFKAVAGSPDFYNGGNVPIGTSFNYVTSTLGPDGLPVFNPSYTASGSVLPPNAAYLNSSKEILYWVVGAGPSGTPITADGTGTITL